MAHQILEKKKLEKPRNNKAITGHKYIDLQIKKEARVRPMVKRSNSTSVNKVHMEPGAGIGEPRCIKKNK